MVFVISLHLLWILVTSFATGIKMAMYFSVFSPKQVNCFSDYSANFLW